MSSSKSGQWMPSPRPMKRQWLRSCCRRGNHASGAVMVRPSDNSTNNVSAVTRKSSPAASRSSSSKVFIPFSQQFFAVFFDQPLNPIKFNTTKPAALLQPHRVERFALVSPAGKF